VSFWCFLAIGVSQFTRNGSIKQTGLRAIISSSSGLLASPDPDDPLEPNSQSSNKKHGLVRSILAIHILTQGVVRYIRDWYVRREKRDSTASIGDPEAGKAAVDAATIRRPVRRHQTPILRRLYRSAIQRLRKRRRNKVRKFVYSSHYGQR
jgi:hypothetical protein